jgi:hypothetical protein
MPLDFSSAARLFMGSEVELAKALQITVADVRSYRTNPGTAPKEVLDRLGRVLIERGTGMARVGEMLRENSR